MAQPEVNKAPTPATGAGTSGEAGDAAITFGNSEFVVPGQGGLSAQAPDEQGARGGEEQGKVPDYSDLSSPAITEDLMKDRITGLSVEEQSSYEPNSYLIDLTGCEAGITYESSQALKTLLSKDGTVGIYINTRTSVFLIGHADSYTTYSLLDRLIKPLFGDGVKLYYNQDGAFKQVKSVKLTTVRLGL